MQAVLLLAGMSMAAVSQQRCQELQAHIDGLPSLDAVDQYLKVEVDKQADYKDVFLCLGGTAQHMPTHETPQGKLLLGDGYGSLFAAKDLPFWNKLQPQIARMVWGGKVLQKRADGSVHLLNVMTGKKTMLFAAEVSLGTSILDGKQAVLLDYRQDRTVPALSPVIARIRDELREVMYRGARSGIYLGRANIFTLGEGSLNNNKVWGHVNSYKFAANFYLDFRAKKQALMPSWAAQHFA